MRNDIELASLEVLAKYEDMLGKDLPESRWQALFDDNPFILNLRGPWEDCGPIPRFSRIARHVENVRALPNILVFVNHDTASSYNDLPETLKGMLHAAGGERFETMTHISEGGLGAIKHRIDLYAWIDARTRRVQGYVFSEASPERVKTVCDLLGLDASKIKHRGSVCHSIK